MVGSSEKFTNHFLDSSFEDLIFNHLAHLICVNKSQRQSVLLSPNANPVVEMCGGGGALYYSSFIYIIAHSLPHEYTWSTTHPAEILKLDLSSWDLPLNDFVIFVFMVLFGNHRLLFRSFGTVPRAQIPLTETTTSDFETKPRKQMFTQSLFSNRYLRVYCCWKVVKTRTNVPLRISP